MANGRGLALLLLVTLALQVSLAEDLYWEGEGDSDNEFLEVKEKDSQLGEHLNRWKRQLFGFPDWWSSGTTSTTAAPENLESNTDDPDNNVDDSASSDPKDDDVDNGEDGSGQFPPDRPAADQKEKTLRVTFVVIEPYQQAYSNRDSPEFKNLSQTLAEAVDNLYKDLEGEQKASLVRIQSRVTDEFSCKVTLDITTSNYDNTDRIAKILKDHIHYSNNLGAITVKMTDFNAKVIDPGNLSEVEEDQVPVTEEQGSCQNNEVQCRSDGRCLSFEVRCNGVNDCSDGSDELNCPPDAEDFGVQEQVEDNTIPDDSDNNGYKPETGVPTPEQTPELDSSQNPENHLNADDQSNNGNAPTETWSNNVNQRPDEQEGFVSRNDNIDDNEWENNDVSPGNNDQSSNPPGNENRQDNSNQEGENVPPGHGNQIPFGFPTETEDQATNEIPNENRSDTDGRSDVDLETKQSDCESPVYCPSDPSIKLCEDQRCNGIWDCSDGYDEENCGEPDISEKDPEPAPQEPEPVNPEYSTVLPVYCHSDDLKCDETRCIPKSSICDGRADCYDGADEFNCPDPTCSAGDFRCNDNTCIEAYRLCDRVFDCPTHEDEFNCTCESNEFRCEADGACIEEYKQCNGQVDCPDSSDERNCPSGAPQSECSPGAFICNPSSNVRCAHQCDGNNECDQGEDEEDCEKDCHMCDNQCLPNERVCDRIADCSDHSDEIGCVGCDGPDDFRCDNDECIDFLFRCNNYFECSDHSDEKNCNETKTTSSKVCSEYEFRCLSGECINLDFKCDSYNDCDDNSDEENCPSLCLNGSWQCKSGQCIEDYKRCDKVYDCADHSDEDACGVDTPETTISPPNTPRIPSESPVALNLQTYPKNEKARNGGDVVLQCRDEGPKRAPVRWVREGGRPLKPGFVERNGRLELFQVTPGDSGIYICQAPLFLSYSGSEVRVSVEVNSNAPVTVRPYYTPCRAHEATCADLSCVAKSLVCDGRKDCRDGSDEDNCPYGEDGKCEPNQFKCASKKCILKTWRCDSQDDCGDGSDEVDCPYSGQDQSCLPAEFQCHTSPGAPVQCVPKSYHCDMHSDCLDGSDEIGCTPIHVVRPPQPSNLRLNAGDTLTLVCEAVGVPVPFISWRLNWGHVPDKCRSENQNGIGTLICPDMQHGDSGAYSCEAMNYLVTSFAVPDAIVVVDQTDVCPTGFFNSEAQSQSECIRCFCFGESTQCRSADLFTYNMPTPLGEGGTRLVGVTQTSNGDFKVDPSANIDQFFYYQPLRNGAVVTILGTESRSLNWRTGAHPYVTLPETYNGNQLTSYGGHIRYQLHQHSRSYGPDTSAPTIIIKSPFGNLLYTSSADTSENPSISVRLTPENWQRAGSRGLQQATREDIMMALDNIESILLRGDVHNAGVNITDFVMESAHHINSALGVASLVEECTCPPGYEGLSCEKCTAGYTRGQTGPWLGNCVRESCPPGTFGDPSMDLPCQPCPCPLTNRDNQFARTCSLGYNGDVQCDCNPGYEGSRCEVCAPGYVGNPNIPGDSCKVIASPSCNDAGTKQVSLQGDCQCKENVQGRFCDECIEHSFFLSSEFRHGCALCFCSGESQKCMSSNLRRTTITENFNVPSIEGQVTLYSSSPDVRNAVRYTAPLQSPLKPVFLRGVLDVPNLDRAQPTVYYWSLPNSFSGDKVTSYGGYLNYVLENVPTASFRYSNKAADVQLLSDNHLTFQYYVSDFTPNYNGVLNVSIQLLEKGWQRSDGKEVAREQFLLALADVKTILVKASYSSTDRLATPVSASIDIAEPNGNGPLALHVEQCECPIGHIGTSCEDCAPGFTRGNYGFYLRHCEPCNCNGHATSCDPESGVCLNCGHHTAGDQCESCVEGYEQDEYGNCVPSSGDTGENVCRCDSRGSEYGCDDSGLCTCKENVEGPNCDVCRPGTFGLGSDSRKGCLPCYCSGVTSDCEEATHYKRLPLSATVFGDNYGGYTLTALRGDYVINDRFVPNPRKSEIMYVFDYSPTQDLYWSLPNFPGNRVLSYGGKLNMRQQYQSNDQEAISEPGQDVILVGEGISIYWNNPETYSNSEPKTFSVPLTEQSWYILNTNTEVSRSNFMRVLKKLRKVLVKATVVANLLSVTIGDVSMDFAGPNAQAGTTVGVEICRCPPGHSGTSCESCQAGYYQDQQDYCRTCPCNGHDCHLDVDSKLVCNCRPPYTGSNCSTIGGDPIVPTVPPPLPDNTVLVRIISNSLEIKEVGSSVNFTCQASSLLTNQRLPITWSKVNGHLPLGRSFTDSRAGVLVITNLQTTDSGTYYCTSNDGRSTNRLTVTLQVPSQNMTQPTVSIIPPYNEIYEGDRIELKCNATGIPTPTIAWQRATSRPLPETSEFYDDLFIINSAHMNDAGEYRCIATNTAGSVTGNTMITVRSRPGISRESLTVSPVSPSVDEGKSTLVICSATPNVPAESIEWVRQDGADLEYNVRIENGVLYIDNAIPENRGIYVCRSTYVSIPSVSVVLNVVSESVAPTESSNITVAEMSINKPLGDVVTVDCTPSGTRLPKIRWSKLESGFGRSTSQRGNTLIINNVQESDQGYYVCEGLIDSDVIRKIYVHVQIERRERPVLQISPEGEQAVQLGHQHDIHCMVQGIPDPVVTWARSGGRRLSPNTHILPHNILRFDNIDVNDEGEYICTATNSAGSASGSAVIQVRSPPVITITPTDDVSVINGDPVTVQCRADGYPTPQVSIRKSAYDLVPPTSGIATLVIPSMSERDEGDYTCTATSPSGTLQERFYIRISDERGDLGSGDPDISPGPNVDLNHNAATQIALEGQQEIIIYCNSTGNNLDGSIVWTRADRPLQRNAYQNGQQLIIRGVTKADSGQYVCSLYTASGDVQTAAYISLRVVRRPQITLHPKQQTVAPGQSPTVECVVDGDDEFRITWRAYSKPLSSRVMIRNNTLIFRQIKEEDAGSYECFATNAYTNSSAIAEVVVREQNRPASESHDHEQHTFVGSSVQLSCGDLTKTNIKTRWSKDGRSIPRSVRQRPDGSLFIKYAQKSDSGHYVCYIRDEHGRRTNNFINLHIEGPPEQNPILVSIERPFRPFRVGDHVQVLCKTTTRDTNVKWEKVGTNQYLDTRTYGDGSLLNIPSVQEYDAVVYRCRGTDAAGREYYEDFQLEVEPASRNPNYENDDQIEKIYTANIRDSVEMVCDHNLEEPVSYEWNREYLNLPDGVSSNQQSIYLEDVKASDAGIYVCRSSNGRLSVETRALLKVVGIVPRFNGGHIILPPFKDTYSQFDIEISFKPTDNNGLILFNSQTDTPTGDYIALQLVDGIPRFTLDAGNGTAVVESDRPLELNAWHNLRITRTRTKLTMNVDNRGTFTTDSPASWLLELERNLIIGGSNDNRQLPPPLAGAQNFIGCISTLILSGEEKNWITDSLEIDRIETCDVCGAHQCQNNGACQEALNNRGYTCICQSGFAGENCDRTGEACRPQLCGPGRCSDTPDGYKCSCPLTHTGRNCEEKQNIEFPAFTGSGFIAINPPQSSRFLRMSMKIKASAPVTDGIIMYGAESDTGYGGFTSLAVKNKRLEFRYDVGEGNPVVLDSDRPLLADQWTDVEITRSGLSVSLKIDAVHKFEQTLDNGYKELKLKTALYVGGIDDSTVLNNNTGVSGGFFGCIKDVKIQGKDLNFVNSSILSANIQECTDSVDGHTDILPQDDCFCNNGGICTFSIPHCACQPGFTGELCEYPLYPPPRSSRPANPCAVHPCHNGGTCKQDFTTVMNYTCDCPLGVAGATCQIQLDLHNSVGFNGNGYLELPARLLSYEDLANNPAIIALAVHTTHDGVLFYQQEARSPGNYGDFLRIRIERGYVVVEWDLGSGLSTLTNQVFVSDGERHNIVVVLREDNSLSLSVDINTTYGTSAGIASKMNADSNVYIGGIPGPLNTLQYPGLDGCIEQIELMSSRGGIVLGEVAVAGRNTQRCRDIH